MPAQGLIGLLIKREIQKLETQTPAAGKDIKVLISLSKIKPVQSIVGRFGKVPRAHLRQLQVCGELTQQWPGSVLDKDASQRKRFMQFTAKAK